MEKITAQQNAKRAAAYAAADMVPDNILLGLGTGSTAALFISRLIERCRQGLRIKAVATSEASRAQALAGGLSVVELNDIPALDLTVDGADEIDGHKRMIKGGGGALLREKIVANASRDMLIIVDESKIVERLGGMPLPVEIVPFAWKMTMRKLSEMGFPLVLRLLKNGDKPYVTDNGNYIVDIQLAHAEKSPEELEKQIRSIPGVVETGFFFNLAKRLLVGFPDGRVEMR